MKSSFLTIQALATKNISKCLKFRHLPFIIVILISLSCGKETNIKVSRDAFNNDLNFALRENRCVGTISKVKRGAYCISTLDSVRNDRHTVTH